ncbi:AbfB domain-containing protein [Glycomyces sp. L485]|uniref:AbfB domain-containing protein n=1 Tax=Glycomyces sp. L485 TaxID=2909235 RepID=UPI001F4B6E05|nr:AbfB domain-containing protein [Glycomyces sp. L485]MCH7229432.1 AbfB domain-containing protein [Glycomyces sp. L485]
MNVRTRRAARICSAVAAFAIIPLAAVPAAGQEADVIRVDLGQTTGDFLGGASGTLYGLYDEGLPSENLVDGIDLTSVSTKAQDGPQHPGADGLEVLGPLVEASNGDVYIYMTDIHRGFPYQWPGDTPEEKLDTYLDKIRVQAEQVATLPAEQQDNIVFMPYNEPEGNMFGTGTWSYNGISWLDDPQYFFDAWDRAHGTIRSVLPDARIGGPNTTVLYNQVYGFMEHAIAAGTVPDTMAWHELSNPAQIRTNVNKYRGWEAEFFAGTAYEGTELPINITEYAYRYHTSVPGQMIQWVSALEDSKVYGDIAYWNIDGNLSDSAVQANRANGQWWLLHAYSQMSGGQTVEVTPPRPGVSYTLQGVATIDTGKRQARALIGGASGANTLAFDNVPSDVFGQNVHAVVREIGWSGQIGDSGQPDTVAELDVAVSGGTAELAFGSGGLPELDAESAYEVIVTPSVSPGETAVPQSSWEATYEAEDATWIGDGLHRNGPEGSPSSVSKFYTSGGYNVGGMRTGSDNAIEFNVSVPEDGVYDLSVFASSLNTDAEVQDQGPTNMFLRVDGDAATEQELFLTLGYRWVVWDHTDTTVELTAGDHVITLATRSLDGTGAITGDVILDKIDLSLPHPDYGDDVYEAEFAEFSGGAEPTYPTGHNGSGPGAAAVPAGGEATFWVYSPDDAPARLDVASLGDRKVELEVNGETVTTGHGGIVDAFLLGGINQVTVKGAQGLEVDRLAVTPSVGADASALYEAEDGVVAGTAEVTNLSLASGGAAVTGIGGDPGNGNTLTFDGVEVPEAGRYALTFRYSNEEQSPATHYNPDPVARYALVSVNGADPVRAIFPHSFHENNFWELTVPVDLQAGANSIVVRGEEKPQFDGTTYASDTWPDVLLRSRFAPNLDRIAVTPLFADVDWRELRSHNYPDRLVRHTDSNVRLEANPSPAEDARFRMVPGLADGSTGYVSFESVNNPGQYLRHSFFELVLAPDDGTALFDEDATFRMVEGLADEWCTSYQSYNFPDQHVRHSGFELQLDPIEDETGRADSTFCVSV